MIQDTQPKISIAMAVYNGEKYLREQLNSIYSQTLMPFEVIAVDDCSTDKSILILTEYEKKYGLKVFRNESNLGVNKTFYKAFKLCSGDYIAPSDQDDVWLAKKLEICYNEIANFPQNEICLVNCQSIYTNEFLTPFLNAKLKSKAIGFYDVSMLLGGGVHKCLTLF